MLLLEEYESTKVKHNKAQEKVKLHAVDIADATQKVEDLKSELGSVKQRYRVLAGNTLAEMNRDDISQQIQVHKDIIKDLKKKVSI